MTQILTRHDIKEACMSATTGSVVESILIGVFFIILLYGLICSGWMTFRASRHIWLWRLYALVIWGSLTLIIAPVIHPSGPELPKSFALGLWLLLAGLAACIAHHLLHLFLRRRHTNASEMHLQ